MQGRLLVLPLAIAACRAIPTADPPPPNVVIVFTDDQGWADVGCYGAEGFETPNLDRMASEGMRLTSFYVAAGVCTPSRAALLTGCHPVRVGLGHRVLFPYSDTGLAPEEVTLAETLGDAGYATGCVGKWHLGHHPEFLPTRQGFDEYFGIPYSNDMDGHYYRHNEFQSPPLPVYRGEEVVEEAPDQAYLTRTFTEEAVDFIERHADEPFFLYLAHAMPHQPIHASEEFRGRSELGLYGDVISEIDHSVGEVLAALERLGIDDRTLVIFTSDNGPWRRESAGPLRGKKNSTWEGGMRLPCILRWPDRIPAGSTSDAVVSSMDLKPTIEAFAGVDTVGPTVDGRDASAVLLGEPDAVSPHEALAYYRDERLQAVRAGRWKLHVHRPEWTGEPHAPLLFDLDTDVGEETDVAEANPDVVRRLEALAEPFRAELGDAATDRIGSGVRPVGRLGEDG